MRQNTVKTRDRRQNSAAPGSGTAAAQVGMVAVPDSG